MTTTEQIQDYINNQPEPKRSDLQQLHRLIPEIMPDSKLWFENGKNSEGKIVSNPSIGYGSIMLKYAGGKTREFYRIGLSANTTGLSVYFMGIADKTYLARIFGDRLGKASVTGYCVKFKTLNDINLAVLMEAIRHAAEQKD